MPEAAEDANIERMFPCSWAHQEVLMDPAAPALRMPKAVRPRLVSGHDVGLHMGVGAPFPIHNAILWAPLTADGGPHQLDRV